jgi:hypothetical protein
VRTSPFNNSALTSREEGASSLITTGICLPIPAIGIASSRSYGLARGKAGGSRGGRSRRVVKVPRHAREDRPRGLASNLNDPEDEPSRLRTLLPRSCPGCITGAKDPGRAIDRDRPGCEGRRTRDRRSSFGSPETSLLDDAPTVHRAEPAASQP